MEISPGRYQELVNAIEGLKKTGMPLVGNHGTTLKPVGITDDIGIYYFIPKIADILHLTPAQSINTFFGGVLIISMLLGIIGCLMMFKKWLQRAVALMGVVFLAIFSYWVGTVYLVAASVVMAVIPLFLSLCFQKNKGFLRIFIFLSGIIAGTAGYIRSQSGTGILIFMIVIVFFYLQLIWKEKFTLIFLMLVGVLIPIFFFNIIIDNRDAYLSSHHYQSDHLRRNHPFWHSVYIGFGYLNNKYGIQYVDKCGQEMVKSKSPDTIYLSPQYEMILRKEVFKLLKNDPLFVTETIFAKMGVIAFYLLVFGNFGLLRNFFFPGNLSFELAFWSAISFYSLNGILVVPQPNYLSGFVAFVVIYGIININYMIAQPRWQVKFSN